MRTEREIILASGSPRRKELLEKAGFSFRVIPAQGEEKSSAKTPEGYVCDLAFHKADEVYNRISRSENTRRPILVIGADTIVVLEGDDSGFEILGKPKDRADAARMIKSLQGRRHSVFTGCAFLWNEGEEKYKHTFYEETSVNVWPMTEKEIASYIDTEEPYDKAGGYGIQGRFGIYIRDIRGSYSNVVGLPNARVYHEWMKIFGGTDAAAGKKPAGS